MDIEPRDVDIITSLEVLEYFKRRFKKYQTLEIGKRRVTIPNSPEYYELKLNINNIEIHVNGEFESDLYIKRLRYGNIVTVKIDGRDVPCFDLETEAHAYSVLKGNEKAKLIKDFLNSDRK